MNTSILRALVSRFPAVVPHLGYKALYLAGVKTYEYFERELSNMIRDVYNGYLGGEFTSILENMILGQISQAYEQAWMDEGHLLPVAEYVRDASQAAVLDQYQYVEQFYRDIIDARVDNTPLEPLLARASMWANRYTEGYNNCVALITQAEGGNLVWRLGQTEQHCGTCASLNGIVARASEWDELGVHPQNAPNDALECGGWQCDCSLEPTDKRRSPKAFDTIVNAVSK